jgi:hypothetical protein
MATIQLVERLGYHSSASLEVVGVGTTSRFLQTLLCVFKPLLLLLLLNYYYYYYSGIGAAVAPDAAVQSSCCVEPLMRASS